VTDYYEILGVPRDASPEQIKKAYRKLARELHPDVAGPGVEDQFKDVSRAYEVLSNPSKREQYDLGVDPTAPGGGAGAGGGFGFQDIFETFFGGGQQRQGPIPRSRRGQDALIRVDLDLVDAVFGVRKELTVETAVVCDQCHGSCCAPGSSPQTCEMCHGRGTVQRVARSFLGQVMTTAPCPHCQGFGTVLPQPCAQCAGEGRVRSKRQIEVDIPAGVDTGTRVKLTGQGEVGPAGGPAGDLYLEIHERKHDVFERRGDDLHCSMELPMTAAALGAVVPLETFDGAREIDVQPGTQPGQTVVLKDLGVGHLNGGGRGDLHVHVEVHVASDLTPEQTELLKQLAVLRGEERPEPRIRNPHPGVFSRLREKLSGR